MDSLPPRHGGDAAAEDDALGYLRFLFQPDTNHEDSNDHQEEAGAPAAALDLGDIFQSEEDVEADAVDEEDMDAPVGGAADDDEAPRAVGMQPAALTGFDYPGAAFVGADGEGDGPASALGLGDIFEPEEDAAASGAEFDTGGGRRAMALTVGLGALLLWGAAVHRFGFDPRPTPSAAAANTEASVGEVVDCGIGTGGRGGPCYPLGATMIATAVPSAASYLLQPDRDAAFDDLARTGLTSSAPPTGITRVPTADDKVESSDAHTDSDAGHVRFPAVDCGTTGHGFCFPAGITSSAPTLVLPAVEYKAEVLSPAAATKLLDADPALHPSIDCGTMGHAGFCNPAGVTGSTVVAGAYRKSREPAEVVPARVYDYAISIVIMIGAVILIAVARVLLE